jgi:GNAT superfamily N-acetyltransferase
MLRVRTITTVEDLQRSDTTSGVTPLSATEFATHGVDLHLLVEEGGELRARCSLWWRNSPPMAGERIGFVGHYEALSGESAALLLDEACRQLAGQGCTLAIGPLDGSTWRRYRFITRRGAEPPFFLEPDNPDDYPRHFEDARFLPFSRYYSSLNRQLAEGVTLPAGLESRLSQEEITVRTVNIQLFDEELQRLYELSLAGFRHNLLYSDISRDEFMGMYAKVRPFLKSELLLFAEHHGEPVGFIFALPDLLRQQRGQAADTVILKSMAVLPQWNGKGIGAALMARVSANARELGFSRAIHALMHEENRSRKMSGHYGEEICQYTLYCRELA